MTSPALITLPFKREHGVSPLDSEEDKFPESLPRYFIKNYSKAGDKIFDPFMGHGTTAFVAEELSRIPYGIEADDERHEWCAAQIKNWNNIFNIDAFDIDTLSLPKMDLCVTSPPFMALNHQWNPLFGGDKAFNGYDKYLERLDQIFSKLPTLMKKSAPIIVHADNIREKIFTPLVRDFSLILSEYFKPAGEVVILWENALENYPFSQCLVFKNTASH